MKNLLFILVTLIFIAGFTLKAKTPEEKDLSCISLLKTLAKSEKKAKVLEKWLNMKNLKN